MMDQVVKKRNANVELLRIIACFIVIGVHVKLSNFVGGSIDRSRVLISCFLGDGVTIFWLVTGFFLFRETSFLKVAKRTIVSIVLPAFFIMVCSQILAGWVDGERTLLDTLRHPSFDARNLFGNIVKWSAGMTHGFHLWYVFQYVKNILWFPVLAFICREEKKARFARRFVMLLCLANMLLQDVQSLSILPYIGSVRLYSIIDPSVFQILLGYEIYTNFKESISGNRFARYGGLAVFLLGNAVRSVVQYAAFTLNMKNDRFVFWNTGFGTLCATGLVVFILSFSIQRDKLGGVIRFVASKTFYIYLLHVLIYRKLNALGIRSRLYTALGGDQAAWFQELLFTVGYTALVFTIAFILSTLWQTTAKLLVKAGRKIRPKRMLAQKG